MGVRSNIFFKQEVESSRQIIFLTKWTLDYILKQNLWIYIYYSSYIPYNPYNTV